MVTVSAPGKIHLMGEHAVVYGKPALLSAVNRRLIVSIESSEKQTVVKISNNEAQDFVLYALSVVAKQYKVAQFPPVTVKITSQIPFGYHLGSSAALAVATVGAAVYFLKKLWNPIEINQLAYEVEKKQHGNPSGGDNTAVTFGGFVWYRKELEFLKSMWQLPFKPASNLNHFFLINTGKPEETTGEMVAAVGEVVAKDPATMEQIFNSNEKQTKRITQALKAGNEIELLASLKEGESTLEAMGVVSPSVANLIRTIEKNGGAAKISGGGGRKKSTGFVLCYHKDPEKIVHIVHPYTIEAVVLGEEGVRLHR